MKSSKKLQVLDIDLIGPKEGDPPQMTLSELKTKVREQIARKFQEILPEVLDNYDYLALKADSHETQRKASEFIFKEFREDVPRGTPGVGAPTMNIQIVNSIPLPEVSNVGGKSAPIATIAGAKVALGQIVDKKLILPEQVKLPKKARSVQGKALEPSEVLPVETLDSAMKKTTGHVK